MRSLKLPAVLLALGLAMALGAIPALGFGSGGSATASGPAASGSAGLTAKAKKRRRCHWVRVHGRAHGRRVCKKIRPPVPPTPEVPGGTAPPGGSTGPGGSGHPGGGGGGEPPESEYPGGGGPGGGGPKYETVDLIADPGFEDTTKPTGCFEPFSDSDGVVAGEATTPIAASNSLRATLTQAFGARISCGRGWEEKEGPIARKVTIEGKLRIDAPLTEGAELEVCAIVYYDDERGEPKRDCHPASRSEITSANNGILDVKGTIEAAGEGRRLAGAYFQLESNSTTVTAILDEAHIWVEELEGSEGSGNGGGGGGGGGGGASAACTKAIGEEKEPVPNGPPDPTSPCDINDVPAAGSYVPGPLTLPTQRPFISLADYTKAPATSPIARKFEDCVKNIDSGSECSNADAVVMYARTHEAVYIEEAIARVNANVEANEAQIAKGEQPEIVHDDYLYTGPEIEELALTYDYGIEAGKLSAERQQKWKELGDEVVSNLWSPLTAAWGPNKAAGNAWDAWAINDPGDNYNYSFVTATQMWALATQNHGWMEFLQRYKFPLIVNYLEGLPGGGSREGTGYGVSQRVFWENARIWRDSTGEDLPAVRNHARESAEYWLNATVPTLDMYAPIGDLSRQSFPELFDYHEDLMREAAMAAPGTEQARHAAWWLKENSIPETLTRSLVLRDALPVPADINSPQAPTALSYHATGVGQLFGRSSWSKDATWFNFTGGPYDQSHAHEDQGAFNLFRNEWLAVTSNIWSASGLQGGGGGGKLQDRGTGVSNVIRFTRPGPGGAPQTIRQNNATSTMTVTPEQQESVIKAHADLTPAYSDHSGEVHSWTRDIEFHGNQLHVHDVCSVGSGVGAVFQVNVPVEPHAGSGSVTAGKLALSFPASYQVSLVDMTSFNEDVTNEEGKQELAEEFERGWRIDITNPNACEFDVDLTANP
jgi:hypothetical protein